jgi:hypothetical protein
MFMKVAEKGRGGRGSKMPGMGLVSRLCVEVMCESLLHVGDVAPARCRIKQGWFDCVKLFVCLQGCSGQSHDPVPFTACTCTPSVPT